MIEVFDGLGTFDGRVSISRDILCVLSVSTATCTGSLLAQSRDLSVFTATLIYFSVTHLVVWDL